MVRLAMTLDMDSKILRTTSAMETLVGNEVVLMVLESGNVYGLGDTGSAVWKLLAKPTTLQPVVDALVEEYDAPRSVIEHDVLELIEEMVERGLVTLA